MFTYSNRVATKPYPERYVKTKIQGGFAVIDQKQSLQSLEVVFPNYDHRMALSNDGFFVHVGDTVFVRGDSYNHQWAKEVYEHIDGTKFILIPKEFIMAIHHKE